MNNIFVGNLSFEATKEDVRKLFETFGTVAGVLIMEGKKKGKSRGYGFVDMPNEAEKNAAIAALQGKEFMWRPLSVSPVVPKEKTESKYYNKMDGPPKPWRKSNTDSKPARQGDRRSKTQVPAKPWRKGKPDAKLSRKVDAGSRPYYGKKENGPKPAGTSKLFMKPIKKGFKMHHKVSGIPKSIKSTDGL